MTTFLDQNHRRHSTDDDGSGSSNPNRLNLTLVKSPTPTPDVLLKLLSSTSNSTVVSELLRDVNYADKASVKVNYSEKNLPASSIMHRHIAVQVQTRFGFLWIEKDEVSPGGMATYKAEIGGHAASPPLSKALFEQVGRGIFGCHRELKQLCLDALANVDELAKPGIGWQVSGPRFFSIDIGAVHVRVGTAGGFLTKTYLANAKARIGLAEAHNERLYNEAVVEMKGDGAEKPWKAAKRSIEQEKRG